MSSLDELLSRFREKPPNVQKQIVSDALKLNGHLRFIPNEGPQTQAYFSRADVLLFGGSPGGGKSALEIGLGLNEHHRTLLVRKSFTDLEGLIDTAKKLVGAEDGFIGGARPKYRKPDGGVIHFAGLAADGGIGGHQGVDHDLICIDEAAQIPEAQVRLLMGWLRTDRPGQRCRVVLGSNPPLDSTGDWMIDYFGPWLNPTHPNPAKPGELRYFLPTDDGGKDRECEAGDSTVIGGVTVYAQSRTYIPSKFTDNPFYNAEEYAKTLAALPSNVREILVTGNFMLARQDQEFQVIPTAWVKAAQERWTDRPPQNIPMCAMGVDASGGGADPMVIASRHDGWYAPLVRVEGKDIPLERIGKHCAGIVISYRLHDAKVIVDLGGGYGGPLYEQLIDNIGSEAVVAYKGAEASVRRTKDQKMAFFNKRSQAIWQFREALDPSQEGGSPISLPPDPELVSDLTAPVFEVTPRGYKVESKESVCERLGRSPDKGDAAVMAWYSGARAMTHAQIWSRENSRAAKSPSVSYGPRRPNGMRRH